MHKKQLGLIGYPLSHSFSKKYFTEKFEKEGIIGWEYTLFPIANIAAMPILWQKHPNLVGLNVTIPYKTTVIPLLDTLDPEAEIIGAVNCIKKKTQGQLIGYNTDVIGFEKSLRLFLGTTKEPVKNALIWGNGGAAKAVKYVLEKLNIPYQIIGRADKVLDIPPFSLLVNTTPLGMYPEGHTFPLLPYEQLNETHFLYDLVYNPEETEFLKKGKIQGATTINGLPMLHLQAEAGWEIFKSAQ